MAFLTAVGALVVGFVVTAASLIGVLLGWRYLSDKYKSNTFLEVGMMPALCVTVFLLGWLFNATAGDAGVAGVVLAVVTGISYVYHASKPKPSELENLWDRLTSGTAKRQNFLDRLLKRRR